MTARHVYVHVPFCARRCSYCDFAIAVRARVPVDEYVSALEAELTVRFPHAVDWTADTLYFGGGTPSLLGGAGVARMLDAVRARVELSPGAEVTLEANPDDVSAEAVRAWTAAGVTRLSLGGQTFSDEALRWMRRSHGSAGIVAAMDTARAGGLTNVSFDLIFALPDGVERSWAGDIDRALALEPAHLSLYGLTVEPGTPLARWRERGAVHDTPDARYADEFLLAHDRLTAAGYRHYEVSNFAGTGGPSRHNSAYWSGAPYVGLGPSAHGYDGVRRRWNVAHWTAWQAALAAGRDPREGDETLTAENRAAEAVYLGLRTDGGLVLAPGKIVRVARWVDAGWAELSDDGRLRLTATGWLRLDALAADLALFRSP